MKGANFLNSNIQNLLELVGRTLWNFVLNNLPNQIYKWALLQYFLILNRRTDVNVNTYYCNSSVIVV